MAATSRFKVEKFDGTNDFGLWRIRMTNLLVRNKDSISKVWEKLQALYMTKSLTNMLYLKQRLYQLKMSPGTFVSDHLNMFTQIMMDLQNVDVKIEDEDQALLLLCSLPESYESFVDTMLFGRRSIILEYVTASLKSRELKNMVKEVQAHGSNGERLIVRGR
ncbi:hypothetical protein CRG98_026473 [Punica granatum]|uniref:Retrovirus-related Pol polyprotein from transposon TNT 1-94 n=1 Tax=Punica granatum TaxID=22663 RepID=A0A2I0JA95_PUNGR|nr:hypothetical protein CRG98_026473 [Punica granatum]